MFCDDECESVAHVLWDCPAYTSIRNSFMEAFTFNSLGPKFIFDVIIAYIAS